MTLHYLTATTGNSMTYERNGVPDEIVHHALESVRNDSGILWDGWSFKVTDYGPDRVKYDLIIDGIPITRCWLCRSEAVADAVWQNIVAERLPIRIAKEPPKAFPWLVVGLTIESIDLMLTKPLRMVEAISAEVAVAFALMEPVH